jgi:hypothetical protein
MPARRPFPQPDPAGKAMLAISLIAHNLLILFTKNATRRASHAPDGKLGCSMAWHVIPPCCRAMRGTAEPKQR